MPPTAPVRLSGWLMALVPVMFSYSGWNAAVYVAEEIRDPVRNVPRALAIGTGAIVALYLALNALYLRVVPFEQFSGSVAVGEVAAERLFGSAAGYLFAVVAILIILSSLSAMTMAGPRVYFAMARDGVFLPRGRPYSPALPHAGHRDRRAGDLERAPRAVGHVRAAAHATPGSAIVLFSALAVLSLFFVRRTATQAATFRAWGYPWAPALFCIVSFAIVINTIVEAPGVASAGLLVMAAGVPMYWYVRRRNGKWNASGLKPDATGV